MAVSGSSACCVSVTYYFHITTLLLWEAGLSFGGHISSVRLLGGSVRVVAFDNVVVVFTAFVASWVVPFAQGTFCRRVLLLDTI